METTEVRSFLQNGEGDFIPVEDWAGPIDDEDYIEGAIELSIGGRQLMDTSMFDYVDQLWAYIAEMLVQLETESVVRTHFPDQPIEFSIERTPPRGVIVSLDTGTRGSRSSAWADEEAFTTALREAGTSFFTHMQRIVPSRTELYGAEIEKLSRRPDR